jgi:DNA ligase-associated metallophosphoesterase
MPQDLDITIANEPVKLLAERAALLVDRGTLIVADLHLGTPETHRSLAVSMPEGIAEEALDRLERIVAKWQPKRLTLLGDLVQLTGDPDDPLIHTFARWRNRISLPISMIGGHAEAASTIPASWRIDDDGEHRRLGRFELRHHPKPRDAESTKDTETIIAGHLHPVISLGTGSRRTLAPAFVFGRGQLILPAFAPYARGVRVQPDGSSAVYAIKENSVIEIHEG